VSLTVFCLDSSRDHARRITDALGVPLGAHEEREFEDGEHKCRPLENVRGNDVYVVASLWGDEGSSVNDKLIRLLFFLGALKDASAARLTAVVPYLCYARKDRRTKTRDPVSTRYVAALFEAVGADHVVTLDVHNTAAFQNAFRIPTDHLEARPLFVRRLAGLREPCVVVSPDVGGVKRAEALRLALERRLGTEVPSAFMEKHRSAGVVSGEALVGDVEGRTVIIVDDLVASGTTLVRAAAACRAKGAGRIVAAVTHGVFSPRSGDVLRDSALERLLVTDSIPPRPGWTASFADRIEVVDTAAYFAEAIRRMHEGGSVTALLED
jgi:ribose-phosphate pyrophosphokinase